ncbi:MAG TPA: MerR family transcriptional regulator [Gaiellaceae bacterium]|nr:MerR family transcriptional regulator [Gaiellaceae bacterium]
MTVQATPAYPAGQGARPFTIGAVRRALRDEFPDISISKIRYLEDQGLLTPRRTQGGYRLYTEEDVERLQTILRLQRDEFLPLRVIRQELASPGSVKRERRRTGKSRLQAAETEIDGRTLCERSGTDAAFVRELEEYGLLEPRVDEKGESRYQERDVEVAMACRELNRHGLAPRNLRKFRTNADGAVDLLRQLVAPTLASANPERRLAGLEELEELGAVAGELSQALFWRALRSLVA